MSRLSHSAVEEAMVIESVAGLFRDESQMLPNFNSIKDDLTIEQWLDKMDEYEELYL
jgi:hypothetical protein